MIEVTPSDLLAGRVEPFVRRAILDGTATPSPALLSQGDMRQLLANRDRIEAARRGLDQLTIGELQDDLDRALADRQGAMYRTQPEWAEHVEDTLDDLDVELARRGVRPWGTV